MSQMNRPAPNITLERAASIEKFARAKFFAYNQKRTMPPRINPVGILLLILSAGTVFIGLTITIVANWPGLASLGENRLKIAGPVILALGFLGLICTVAFMWVWAAKHNELWEKDMTIKAQKYLSSAQSQEPLVFPVGKDPYSQKEPGQHRMAINGLHVEPNPNPNQNGTKKTRRVPNDNGSGSFHDSSFDSYKVDTGEIPAPVRVQKKRSSTQKGELNLSSGSTNQTFSAGEGDMSIPGISFGSPRGSVQPTYGFGKLSGQTSPIYSNNNEIERYSVTKVTTTKTTQVVQSNHRNAYGSREVDPIRQPIKMVSDNYDRTNQGLRVLIKAQPGTAVYITPSSTPPGGHPTRMSMDTEI